MPETPDHCDGHGGPVEWPPRSPHFNHNFYFIIIYFLTAIGLTPGDSSTVHIYTQTVHRIQRTEHT
jgi:hypothetical protein